MKPFKVLYICTHNRCRSQLYQAVTNELGKGIVIAESAGSSPEDRVNADAIKLLERNHIATDSLTSKSWNDVADFTPDLIITVCDSAAGEVCPVWFGDTPKLHWPTPDPSKLTGTDEEIEQAFDEAMVFIKHKVQSSDFMALVANHAPDLGKELS